MGLDGSFERCEQKLVKRHVGFGIFGGQVRNEEKQGAAEAPACKKFLRSGASSSANPRSLNRLSTERNVARQH